MAVTKRKRGQRKGPTPRKGWTPLAPAVPAQGPEQYEAAGIAAPDRAFINDLYTVFVRDIGHGAMHISFHRHDRGAVRDWRHYQAIKNEVAGPERTAIEIFPPESQLFDTANEYHLWVLPVGYPLPFVATRDDGPQLMTDADVKRELGDSTRARQRDWERGIPTGLGAQA